MKFERPPVVEVVLSVSFALPKPLQSAHIGLFWNEIKGDYPDMRDVAPLNLTLEGTTTGITDAEVQVMQLPPLRRSWFVSADGRNLVQLQEDRFIYNWKRVDEKDAYPSYEKIFAEFSKEVERFIKFLDVQQLGDLSVLQLELAYVNHIEQKSDFLSADRMFIDHYRNTSNHRFLPMPESFRWNSTYALPYRVGRLHIVAQNARLSTTGESVIRVDLTARGLPVDTSLEDCKRWFDIAHTWITQGFADITSPDLHNSWGRTQ
ncbi:MAG: TIGR04255 family protein [Janthinobacterium lividum]